MGAMSRRKGASGERELFALLSGALGGIVVRRNLVQTREGGADTVDIAGWSVEVKRAETLSLSTWINQTAEQAARAHRRPLLFYRSNRQPWRAVVDLHDLAPTMFPVRFRSWATVEFDVACQVIRETLSLS